MAAKNTTDYPGRISVPNFTNVDNVAVWGLLGNLQNNNALMGQGVNAILIASSTTPTLTAAEFISRIWDISGSPGGGFTITTPTAAEIIAALPKTIPGDGTCNFWIMCMNDDCGQTGTVTAGTGVTVLGTATVATNTNRTFWVNVNVGAGTVTMLNLGTMSL